VTLLLYTSHRQRCVTYSSVAAEVYELLEGVRAVLELAAIHTHILTENEFNKPPVDAFTDNLSLYNTLDTHGVVQAKAVGAAVQELRGFYHVGTIATVTWLRARVKMANALTRAARDTPMQQTIKTGMCGVRMAGSDYLTKWSPAAPSADARSVCIVCSAEPGCDGQV